MAILDITKCSWNLICWRQWEWRLCNSFETGDELRAAMGPYPAKVPGSVQENLLNAAVIKDWNYGRNSLECEWVENRHWEFRTTVKIADAVKPHILTAECLDYSGWVLIDKTEVGEFCGSLLKHSFDLTNFLSDGEPHMLRIIFDFPPLEQGQIGYTSQSRHFKPRFNYGWDWCPRFVPVGIFGDLTIKSGFDTEFEVVKVTTVLSKDFKKGELAAELQVGDVGNLDNLLLKLCLFDDEQEITQKCQPLRVGKNSIRLMNMDITPWMPNLCGSPVTYTLLIEITDVDGKVIFHDERNVGFKTVKWLPCTDASKDAMPWICEVNGKKVFLQGVNWTPVKLDYANTSCEEYSDLLGKYRDMGCNLLRVWGGAALESEIFYDLCDKMGLMVWQEFPLSSSGLENVPPDNDDVLKTLADIARTYINRRAHHPSLLMWCGGNELTDSKGTPADVDGSVCLLTLAEIVKNEDPQRRFVAASPSGPMFCALAEEFGQGVHHDVHGPWGFSNVNIEAWRSYWDGDDSLLRSEVGVPGACDVEFIKKYVGPDFWPPRNPVWMHSCSWWLMWEKYQWLEHIMPGNAIEEYVRQTQKKQAFALAYAAKSCKERFPKCGGFLVWMGHDSFPCPINNSLIDFDKNPKPAYHELSKVFLAEDLENIGECLNDISLSLMGI